MVEQLSRELALGLQVVLQGEDESGVGEEDLVIGGQWPQARGDVLDEALVKYVRLIWVRL